MCKPGRCLDALGRTTTAFVDSTPAGFSLPANVATATELALTRRGDTAEALLNVLANLPLEEGDPRFLIAVTTLRLADMFDRAPSTALNAEIRRNVEWLLLSAEREAGKLDELRARVTVRQAELLMRYVNQADAG
jgi:hypothetical protein